MSGTNPKKSTKSKLVPRTDSDKLQDEPKKKVPKTNQIDDDTPTTSSYRPPQFDIKFEVEECDKDQFDTSANIASNSEVKTEVINENDLFEVEEHAINSFLAHALYKNKKELTSKNNEKSERNRIAFENDHGDGQSDVGSNIIVEDPSKTVYHLKIHEDVILNTLDELFKGNMSPIDKMLGIVMRNLMGRYRIVKHNPSLAEIKIQLVLNSPKLIRKLPYIYKCYICNKAWYHLMPFRDHMNGHEGRFSLTHEVELKHLYNLAALPVRSFHIHRHIKVEERCWRCSNDFEHHRDSYYCEYCSLYFDTCIKYKAHEGECVSLLREHLVKNGPIVVFTCRICKLNVIRKEDLEKHYEDFHDVRSDLPMDVVVYTCATCLGPYASRKFHYCPAKNHSVACNHCLRKFPSRHALDIHLERETDFPCPACKYNLPKKCMYEHFLKHSEKFNMLYKCIYCEDNILLLSQDSFNIHESVWHGINAKRKIVLERVLVPRKLHGSMKSKSLVFPPDDSDDDYNETTNAINSPIPAIEEMANTIATEATNMVEEPSTVIIDKEFEELNDNILNQTMVEGMKKNNFPEDDEGYEYMLSSIFNTTKGSNIDTEIAAEEDSIEEFIMNNDIEKMIIPGKKKLKKTIVSIVKDVTLISSEETNNTHVKEAVEVPTKQKNPSATTYFLVDNVQ